MSDRHGRVFVQRFYAIGPLLADLLFVLLASFASRVPGGAWAVVLAGVADGSFGGEYFMVLISCERRLDAPCSLQWGH